jgi:hypothetical protein
MNRCDSAGFEGLDHLRISNGFDLARRNGVHVKPTDKRPDERRERNEANRRDQRDRERRRRRLEDFERGGKEFAVAARDDAQGARWGRWSHRRRRNPGVHTGVLACSDCIAHR